MITESDVAGVTAVLSHRLLNAMAVVIGVAETLYVNEDALGRERRLQLLALMGQEADGMRSVLDDLVRGFPQGTSAELLAADKGRRTWWTDPPPAVVAVRSRTGS